MNSDFTRRPGWSDRSGRISMAKDTIRLPSVHWQWVKKNFRARCWKKSTVSLMQTTDWLIDFTTPGGVDGDGWQYATDFPASYSGHAGFKDFVRRRRWARKCRVATTGPWKPVGSTKVIDLSLQVTKRIVDSFPSR